LGKIIYASARISQDEAMHQIEVPIESSFEDMIGRMPKILGVT